MVGELAELGHHGKARSVCELEDRLAERRDRRAVDHDQRGDMAPDALVDRALELLTAVNPEIGQV
jgi:hypothetical protein